MATIEKIYEKYSETCHIAHLLETEIGNICAMNSVVMKKEEYGKATPSEKLEMLNKNSYNRTLGALLKDIGKVIDNQNAVETIFTLALNERNRLIHDFYYDYREEINSTEGWEIMMQDLARIRKIIADALSTANNFSAELWKSFPQPA